MLRELKYTHASSLPEDRLVDGDAVALLPALHYCLLGYSTRVAQEVNRLGYELQAKTDERFVEHAWKLMRDHMGIFPQLSPSQFLTQKGFAERKLILVAEVAKTCKRLHSDLSRKAKLKTKRVAKDAHLESYFPPVRGRASGSGNNNSAAVAESSAEAKVVAHHSSPPPLPSTPPQLVLAGAGAPVEMSEERSAASSEYTYDDDDDDDDSGSSGSEGGYESSGGEEEGEISDEEGDRSRAAVLFKHSPVGADAAQPHTPPPGGLDQGERPNLPQHRATSPILLLLLFLLTNNSSTSCEGDARPEGRGVPRRRFEALQRGSAQGAGGGGDGQTGVLPGERNGEVSAAGGQGAAPGGRPGEARALGGRGEGSARAAAPGRRGGGGHLHPRAGCVGHQACRRRGRAAQPRNLVVHRTGRGPAPTDPAPPRLPGLDSHAFVLIVISKYAPSLINPQTKVLSFLSHFQAWE